MTTNRVNFDASRFDDRNSDGPGSLQLRDEDPGSVKGVLKRSYDGHNLQDPRDSQICLDLRKSYCHLARKNFSCRWDVSGHAHPSFVTSRLTGSVRRMNGSAENSRFTGEFVPRLDVNGSERFYRSSPSIAHSLNDSQVNSHPQRQRRSPRKKSKAAKSTPLFIDRLKSDFQQFQSSDVFVSKPRSRRNWYPEFSTRYFRSEINDSKDVEPSETPKRSFSIFVPDKPKVYSIGLSSGARPIELDKREDMVSRLDGAIWNLKRCLELVRRRTISETPSKSPRSADGASSSILDDSCRDKPAASVDTGPSMSFGGSNEDIGQNIGLIGEDSNEINRSPRRQSNLYRSICQDRVSLNRNESKCQSAGTDDFDIPEKNHRRREAREKLTMKSSTRTDDRPNHDSLFQKSFNANFYSESDVCNDNLISRNEQFILGDKLEKPSQVVEEAKLRKGAEHFTSTEKRIRRKTRKSVVGRFITEDISGGKNNREKPKSTKSKLLRSDLDDGSSGCFSDFEVGESKSAVFASLKRKMMKISLRQESLKITRRNSKHKRNLISSSKQSDEGVGSHSTAYNRCSRIHEKVGKNNRSSKMCKKHSRIFRENATIFSDGGCVFDDEEIPRKNRSSAKCLTVKEVLLEDREKVNFIRSESLSKKRLNASYSGLEIYRKKRLPEGKLIETEILDDIKRRIDRDIEKTSSDFNFDEERDFISSTPEAEVYTRSLSCEPEEGDEVRDDSGKSISTVEDVSLDVDQHSRSILSSLKKLEDILLLEDENLKVTPSCDVLIEDDEISSVNHIDSSSSSRPFLSADSICSQTSGNIFFEDERTCEIFERSNNRDEGGNTISSSRKDLVSSSFEDTPSSGRKTRRKQDISDDNCLQLENDDCISTLPKINRKKSSLRTTASSSRQNFVESVDSGVLTDFSKNEANRSKCSFGSEGSSTLEESRRRRGLKDLSGLDSDGSYSDDMLNRRVERAVKRFTEELILCERRARVRSQEAKEKILRERQRVEKNRRKIRGQLKRRTKEVVERLELTPSCILHHTSSNSSEDHASSKPERIPSRKLDRSSPESGVTSARDSSKASKSSIEDYWIDDVSTPSFLSLSDSELDAVPHGQPQ